MKAIRYHRYGGPEVLALEEVEKPTPGDGEVLIAVRAAALNPLDSHFMRGRPKVGRLAFGLRTPKNPRVGVDTSGVVEAVGKSVTRFKPGDEVFGSARGACAEFTCAPESRLVIKPPNVSFDEAACVGVVGITALQSLRDFARVEPGQRVLVNGAAGGVGTFTVQIAKAYGAHVTGVCSGTNTALVRSIGADQAIDYARDDFTKGAARYDVIVDCAGTRSLADLRRALTPKGALVLVGARDPAIFTRMLGAVLQNRFTTQRLLLAMVRVKPSDLDTLAELLSAGKLKPVIDSRYPLSNVADAMARQESWHARGKILVTL